MSDNKHIYRFLRCFNRNKVMIVLSYLFLAINLLYLGLPLSGEIRHTIILLSVVFAVVSILCVLMTERTITACLWFSVQAFL